MGGEALHALLVEDPSTLLFWWWGCGWSPGLFSPEFGLPLRRSVPCNARSSPLRPRLSSPTFASLPPQIITFSSRLYKLSKFLCSLWRVGGALLWIVRFWEMSWLASKVLVRAAVRSPIASRHHLLGGTLPDNIQKFGRTYSWFFYLVAGTDKQHVSECVGEAGGDAASPTQGNCSFPKMSTSDAAHC